MNNPCFALPGLEYAPCDVCGQKAVISTVGVFCDECREYLKGGFGISIDKKNLTA